MPVEDSLDTWFKREIVVHEEALTRFLRRSWRRQPEDIHDLRQETYARVYEAAAKSRPRDPKPFLFATARHLMTDRVRRARVVTIDTVGDLETLNVITDDATPERHTAARQELRVLAMAFDMLPPKCRETVWLRRVDALSQKETAEHLGVTQKTVEKHMKKGMKLLADALFGKDFSRTAPLEEPESTDRETPHGQQQKD